MVLAWVIVLAAFVAGAMFWEQLPEEMASHWNIRGEVDGWMPKFWGVLLIPLVLVGLVLLFEAIPRIDPLKRNVKAFQRWYEVLLVIICLFMLLIHLQVLLWGAGLEVSFLFTIPIGIGILFFAVGMIFTKTKRNWFVGIRTPWTLSSDVVWEKTHKLGGRLFMACGLIALAGAVFQEHMLWLILIPIIASAVVLTVYSYFEYRKEKR